MASSNAADVIIFVQIRHQFLSYLKPNFKDGFYLWFWKFLFNRINHFALPFC